jgi:hypothetical protein
MAILDTEKVDFLWKKIIFGVTKTAGALIKFGSNETIASASPILPTSIWKDGPAIPETPTVSAIVLDHTGAQRIRATTDPTSPPNQAWLATATYNTVSSRLFGFIPPTFGSGYAVKVFVGDPQAGGTRIFPDTNNEEWVFDYAAGVLIFPNNIPSGVAAGGIYLELYRYGGATGAGAASLDELDDVEIGSAGAAEGDILVHRGGVWSPEQPTLPPSSLEDLDNVEQTSAGAQDGDVLTYRGGVWQAEATADVPSALADLTDVDFTTPPAEGDTIAFIGGKWVPQAGGSGGDLGTMAEQDADNVDITGGAIRNVTLSGVTFDAGEF